MSESDWQPYSTTIEDEKECGYLDDASLEIVDALTPDQRRRLAAMAVRHFDSPWSDRQRDLLRGVACILGRLEYEQKAGS